MPRYARINSLTLKVDNIIDAEESFFKERSDYDLWLESSTAGIGYSYDSTKNIFISPKPFSSWILNESNNTWESAIPVPDDGKFYTWDEVNNEWKEI